MRQQLLGDGDTFTHRGLSFRLSVRRDEDMGEPWKEHDGYGIVSEWTRRSKAPGERVLTADRESYRYYDVQASTVRARKDGWGCPHRTGTDWKTPAAPHTTKAEEAACAVDADFRHLQAWCQDEWEWVYVSVKRLDTNMRESLSGIESSDAQYIHDTAHELAENLIDDQADRAKLEATRVLTTNPDLV